jgi:CubicO group peptidase (beta-lactamase class C family)
MSFRASPVLSCVMRLLSLAVIALAASGSASLTAGCRAPVPESPVDSPLDRVVPPILERDRIPAAVIVAGGLEKVTYRRAFGACRADTIFDLASCTKVVATTTAAMKLVEEGRLSLDDPVSKHLAVFDGRAMTIRDLLRHRSGLAAYLRPKARNPDAILLEIASLKTGRGFTYS